MSMTETVSDRRDRAIKKYRDRIEAANRKAEEREANIRAQEDRRQKLYEEWPRIADGIIASTVNALSNDYVQHGSPIFYAAATSMSSTPQRQSDKAMQMHMASTPRSFDVRHQGQSQVLARLQFEIDISTGKINATTTAKDAALPPAILLSDFKPEWALKAAEAVLLAVLEN